MQAVESLVEMAATELQDESSTSVHALNALSAALDAEEAQFAGLVGDTTFHASQRAQHAIGRLLHAVKAQEEFFDEVYEKHLENNEVMFSGIQIDVVSPFQQSISSYHLYFDMWGSGALMHAYLHFIGPSSCPMPPKIPMCAGAP